MAPPRTTTRACLDCGAPSRATTKGRCPRCHHQREAKRDRQRGTRTQRGYDNDWLRLSHSIYQDQPCHYCGAPATTTDHRIPKSRGGTDHEANLVPACRPCNSSKGNR